jgi:hypothetical protein
MIRENAAPSEVRQAPVLAMLLCLGALALLGAHSLGHLRFEDLLQGRPHQCSQKLLVLRQNGFDVDRSRLAFLFLAASGLATGLAFTFLAPETHDRPIPQDADDGARGRGLAKGTALKG